MARIFTYLYIYAYIYLFYHVEFSHLDAYHFMSKLTRFCLFIYIYVFILVVYNSMQMTVSILITSSARGDNCVLHLSLSRKAYYKDHPWSFSFYK